MPARFNANSLPFHPKQSPIPEYAWHTSERLSGLVKSKHLTFDIRSLDPGFYSYPYHYHHNAEEVFVILDGSAMLRTPEGISEVQAGDVLFFEMGESGAHQLFNHTDSPCRYLDIRTEQGLDVAEYPDSGKLNVMLPGGQRVLERSAEVDYYLGEDRVKDKWAAAGFKQAGAKKEEQG